MSKIEVRAALIERINRYRHKRGVSSINDAVEALINIGARHLSSPALDPQRRGARWPSSQP